MIEPFPFLRHPSNREYPWDQILWECSDFVVVPTVGAIVPGWLLIVPKTPALCVGELDSSLRDRLTEVKNFCASVVEEKYGPAAIFEHGPSAPGSSIGCTVDYAHLHVLPAPCGLIDSVPAITNRRLDWKRVESIDSSAEYFGQGTSYLYVEQPIGKAMIADATGMPSQLFRRVIAHSIGRLSEFNWREYPMESNVVATVSMLSKAFRAHRTPALV